MEFRAMTMGMLKDLMSVSNNAMLQHWRDEAQRGLDGCGDRASVALFKDAIEQIDAEVTRRTKLAVVPRAVIEMLGSMTDEALVKARAATTKTTVPQHDELRAMRVANFIKAINEELNTRVKTPAPPPKPDPFAEFAANVPEDLRHFFTEKSPEGPTRADFGRLDGTGGGMTPTAGMCFSIVELNYLIGAVCEFEHEDDAVEKKIGIPLYWRLQQIRDVLVTVTKT